ncbi:MAG: hypothetical protein WAP51_03085 [Candidatus Sungiibacteriota bacterium]
MNKVITIPKGEFVLIPRKKYEALLHKKVKFISVVKLTPVEKRAIAKSEKELARGQYLKLDELEYELGGARSKTR